MNPDTESNESPSQKNQPSDTPQKRELIIDPALKEKIDSLGTPEEKLRIVLDFMKDALAQEGTPHFRGFWEARRFCLPLFKENLNPIVRSKYWSEFTELSKEAKRIKDILDEQSNFAMEQIDLALKDLEQHQKDLPKDLEASSDVEFPEQCRTIESNLESYKFFQKELILLNSFASKINALRKEVMKTEMRIRFKNQFFKRLSHLGDQIFPRRKDLIKEISELFISDVQEFVNRHFQEQEATGAPFYVLREEIKTLQAVSKLMTINTAAFTKTREMLSQCWDRVKRTEKEKKKVFLERKVSSEKNRELIEEKLKELTKKEQEGTLPTELMKELENISHEMRSIELHRDDVRALKQSLFDFRDRLKNELRKEHDDRLAKQKEAEQKKRQRVEDLKVKISNAIKDGEVMDVEKLSVLKDEIQEEIVSLSLSKLEKQLVEKQLKPLKDLISDKKEKSLLDLSDDDIKSLEKLRTILDQRKERRQEIKAQLEEYRKALGGSGFDFEKAMMYRELIDLEKDRLEKANSSIEEIEEKISEIEGS